MIRVNDKLWFLWAMLLLLLPLRWFLSTVIAAFVHECFHVGAVLILGGKVNQIRLGVLGAEIEATGIDGLREAFCAFAGPAGSFFLVFLINRFPILGLCGFAQGIFNLLPVYPLDGGRMILCMLDTFFPFQSAKIAAAIQVVILLLILILSGLCAVHYSFGWYPLLFAVFGILRSLVRKKP